MVIANPRGIEAAHFRAADDATGIVVGAAVGETVGHQDVKGLPGPGMGEAGHRHRLGPAQRYQDKDKTDETDV